MCTSAVQGIALRKQLPQLGHGVAHLQQWALRIVAQAPEQVFRGRAQVQHGGASVQRIAV